MHVGRRQNKLFFFCKNELLEGKGPSESLRRGVVSEPGRRRGFCGRETRDRGAWFPLGTPPGLQAPPLPKMYPPQVLLPWGGPRPPPAASFSRHSAARTAPRASRLSRERETRPPARRARGRPLPSRPLPSSTPTAPAPHPRDPPGAARPPPGYTIRRATGGGATAGLGRRRPLSAGGQGDRHGDPEPPGSAAPCAPRHPSPSAPLWAGVGDRNRLPTWRTGSGPARRREHSSRAGSGGSGPGAPGSKGAAVKNCRVRSPKGASTNGHYLQNEGPQSSPQTENPKATGGSGVAGEGDTSSLCPPTLLAARKRVSRHYPSRDSLGLPEIHPKGSGGGLGSPQLRPPK